MTIQMEEQLAEVDNFLEHYGVKGMKWGVRKSRDEGTGGSGHPRTSAVVADATARNLAIMGSAQAGRIIGSAGGTVIGGPLIGSLVGSYVGGYVGAKAGSRAVYGDRTAKAAAAKKDLPGLFKGEGQHPNYRDGAAKTDITTWGPDSAVRINHSLHQGMKIGEARAKERKLQRTITIVSIGAGLAQAHAINKGVNTLRSPETNQKIYDAAKRHGDRRNARRAGAGPGVSGIRVAKPGRNGVYNVTSL